MGAGIVWLRCLSGVPQVCYLILQCPVVLVVERKAYLSFCPSSERSSVTGTSARLTNMEAPAVSSIVKKRCNQFAHRSRLLIVLPFLFRSECTVSQDAQHERPEITSELVVAICFDGGGVG